METAIVLTSGLLNTMDAKTAHGLIRESNRFKIIGIVDHLQAGKDAGEVLDGTRRDIPVFKDIQDALHLKPAYCIVGVATSGGVFPESMLDDVRFAIEHQMSIVNGLHDYLSERPDIRELASAHQVRLIDIRKPKSRKDLHFWTGGVLKMKTPVVAVIGTDCTLGKRTTTRLLLSAGIQAGMNTQMIYTGQTGWLQGGKYGFIFDSTLNDFVSGELENAILTCNEETNPDVILIEGQSALRNPSGPCGSELLISGNAKHVILVHSPKRTYYDHIPEWGKIPSLETEIALISLYGSKVLAIALNTENCSAEEAERYKQSYEAQFNIPVLLPLTEGCDRIVPLLQALKLDAQVA